MINLDFESILIIIAALIVTTLIVTFTINFPLYSLIILFIYAIYLNR